MGEEHIIFTEEERDALVCHRERLAHIGAIISNLENDDLKFFSMCQVDMKLINGLGEMVEDSAAKLDKCLEAADRRCMEAELADPGNYFDDPEKDEIWKRAFEVIKGPEDGEQYRALRALLKPEPLEEPAPNPAIQERLDGIFAEA